MTVMVFQTSHCQGFCNINFSLHYKETTAHSLLRRRMLDRQSSLTFLNAKSAQMVYVDTGKRCSSNILIDILGVERAKDGK